MTQDRAATQSAEVWLAEGVDARSLPKILLHDHLDGGLRPDTILDLAQDAGIELPAAGEPELREWFRANADSGSLERYLETFDVVLRVLQTPEALHRVAREAVADLAADGVIYAELRWAPEQHLRGGLTLDDVIAAVTAGLREGCEAHEGIEVGQLLCAMRHANDADTIADAALRHRGDSESGGVRGFDLAGPEIGFPPSQHRRALEKLAGEFMPVTIHAGEAAGLESIASALIDGRALRLGHGARIADDITLEQQDDSGTRVTLGPIASWVRERGIALELAPSSNLQTGLELDSPLFEHRTVETITQHPFDLLYQLGFSTTVNTDNRLMSATSASEELQLVADAFDLRLGDLEQLQLNAAEAAFAPLEDREDLADRITEGYEQEVGA
ncbi:adenosine deaminase [Gulosibacter sediminis]|uniref:adenosine deaminase n=1 Tax=Gulosibacter sediminis TaxID=1729695 RepID=UPI0018679587|nr:adenosine deaminase [Gulosibacter sediminis]